MVRINPNFLNSLYSDTKLNIIFLLLDLFPSSLRSWLSGEGEERGGEGELE